MFYFYFFLWLIYYSFLLMLCIKFSYIGYRYLVFVFLNLPTLTSTSALPIGSPPKQLTLRIPSKPHIWTATCSRVYILYRYSKYSFQIFCTSSSPYANLPFASFILLQLSTFHPFALLTSFQNNFIFPFTFSFIFLPNCSFTFFLL